MPSNRSKWTHDVNLTILLVLLGVLLFLPLPGLRNSTARLFTELGLTGILISACATVQRPRRLLHVAVLLTAASVILGWVEFFHPNAMLAKWNLGLSVVVLVLISVVVSIWVLGPGQITGHRIRGAVLVYLLLGLTWALGYALVELVVPGSFALAEHIAIDVAALDRQALMRELIYYSFVTLTTVGYGDITPLSEAGRQLAMLEALCGQLFPVVFIGRMVSLEISDSTEKSAD